MWFLSNVYVEYNSLAHLSKQTIFITQTALIWSGHQATHIAPSEVRQQPTHNAPSERNAPYENCTCNMQCSVANNFVVAHPIFILFEPACTQTLPALFDVLNSSLLRKLSCRRTTKVYDAYNFLPNLRIKYLRIFPKWQVQQVHVYRCDFCQTFTLSITHWHTSLSRLFS